MKNNMITDKILPILNCILMLTCFTLLFLGCSRKDEPPTQTEVDREKQYEQLSEAAPIIVKNSNRFKVVRVAVFYDDIAYGQHRAIYEITDTKLNKEFIGISGVGISETGSHSGGKTITPDER